MKPITRAVAMTLAALTTVALAACSTGTTSTGGAAATDAPKYALILKTLSSEFWQNMKTGAEEEAKKQGVTLDVFAANSEDDVEGQVTLLQNAIGKGYKAIGVAPISAVNMNNAVAQATKAGVFIVNVDEKFDMENLKSLGGTAQSFVTTNNVEVGKMAGDFIVKTLGAGPADVAVIEGKAGNASGADRATGASGSFKEAGYTIVASQPADWDGTKAFDLAQSYISKFADLKAIYCANDTMAMGAQKAVEASGKKIMVVGTDGNTDAIESVKAGKLAATVKQDSAAVGAKSVTLLIDLVKAGAKIDPAAE
ncbi:MAG TPA: D-allose transporter substrate-binding protein, partial [Propionicimonas sp.]|nr:D-allose transporter substrate-binding protein [Propionicimonas sp.]